MTALVTPFTADGALDEPTLRELILLQVLALCEQSEPRA